MPGGFGERGFEGKIAAARYARENNVPYLGLCLGMQVMVVEAARAALGTDAVNSTEFDPETPNPVISLLSEQEGVSDKGGTMRLGGYVCMLAPGSKAAGAYGLDEVRGAPPPPLRVQQRLPRAPRGLRPDRQRHFAGRHAGRGLRDAATTPSWSARSSTRSCARGRTARTRCSASWSAWPGASRALFEPLAVS